MWPSLKIHTLLLQNEMDRGHQIRTEDEWIENVTKIVIYSINTFDILYITMRSIIHIVC